MPMVGPPTFVVSLPGSPRRQAVIQVLSSIGLRFTFWDGIFLKDTKDLEYWKRTLGIDPELNSQLTTGTLGCKLAFMSLFYTLGLALESGHMKFDFVLVLEDDVVLNPQFNWNTIVWHDYVQAEYTHLHLLPPNLRCGNQAQLITSSGILKLKANISRLFAADCPIDLLLWNSSLRVADMSHASYHEPHNWLFKHAVPYLDPNGSERLQINLLKHHNYHDYIENVDRDKLMDSLRIIK
jgi:GR25 family glycosyltransferase involved in LPS biosynthesis